MPRGRRGCWSREGIERCWFLGRRSSLSFPGHQRGPDRVGTGRRLLGGRCGRVNNAALRRPAIDAEWVFAGTGRESPRRPRRIFDLPGIADRVGQEPRRQSPRGRRRVFTRRRLERRPGRRLRRFGRHPALGLCNGNDPQDQDRGQGQHPEKNPSHGTIPQRANVPRPAENRAANYQKRSAGGRAVAPRGQTIRANLGEVGRFGRDGKYVADNPIAENPVGLAVAPPRDYGFACPP